MTSSSSPSGPVDSVGSWPEHRAAAGPAPLPGPHPARRQRPGVPAPGRADGHRRSRPRLPPRRLAPAVAPRPGPPVPVGTRPGGISTRPLGLLAAGEGPSVRPVQAPTSPAHRSPAAPPPPAGPARAPGPRPPRDRAPPASLEDAPVPRPRATPAERTHRPGAHRPSLADRAAAPALPVFPRGAPRGPPRPGGPARRPRPGRTCPGGGTAAARRGRRCLPREGLARRPAGLCSSGACPGHVLDQPAPRPPPDVTVTIGRIEVKMPAAEPAPARRGARRSAEPSARPRGLPGVPDEGEGTSGMSNSAAIAAVTATLTNMLQAAMAVDPVVSSGTVTARPPDRARRGRAGQPGQPVPVPHLDRPRLAQPGPAVRPARRDRAAAAPAGAVVPDHGVRRERRRDPGAPAPRHRAAGLLNDRPVLSRSQIASALPPPGSDLQNQVERVRITPDPRPQDEISRMWTTFNTGYRLSVGYRRGRRPDRQHPARRRGPAGADAGQRRHRPGRRRPRCSPSSSSRCRPTASQPPSPVTC